MSKRLILNGLVGSIAVLAISGCKLPGRPAAGPEVLRPQEVLAFEPLYRQNCAGCHGVNGQNGAAMNLANSEYEAWIDDASLRSVIVNGEKGSLMPAFALSKGGTLTDAQVDILVRGIRAKWATQDAFAGSIPPPYRAIETGSASAGEAVYAKACASCHGATDKQPGAAGSILDSSFLALMDAQTLRTTIVVGRPDIGQPDWRHDVPGQVLTDADVSDVTAWLMAQRPVYLARPNGDVVSERPLPPRNSLLTSR